MVVGRIALRVVYSRCLPRTSNTMIYRHLGRSCGVTSTILMLGVSVGAAAAYAQTEPLGMVTGTEGDASIVRGTRRLVAVVDQPVFEGDRAITGRGRLEIQLDRGAAKHLDLDHDTVIDLLGSQLVRCQRGRLRVTADPGGSLAQTRVDTPDGQVALERAGEYLIAIEPAGLRVSVVRGHATVTTGAGIVALGAGQQVVAGAGSALEATAYNTAAWDAFDRWVERRHESRRGRYASRRLRTRLSVVSRPRAPQPTVAAVASRASSDRTHPHTWYAAGPWGGGAFCCARGRDGADATASPPIGVVPIELPRDELAPSDAREPERPAEPAPPRVAGLPVTPVGAPAPAAASTRERPHTMIVLPRGGTARGDSRITGDAGTSLVAGTDAASSTTPARATSTRAVPSRLRSAQARSSTHLPARSTRHGRVSSRSQRLAAAHPD